MQGETGQRASGRQFRSPGSPRDGIASANRDPDPDIAVQSLKDAHQPVDRKPVEPGLTDARKISRCNASTRRRVANGKPLLVERLDDFRGEEGPELAQACVGCIEVGKDITGASHQFDIVDGLAHASISFRRLIRSRTRSISYRGVEIPFVDFFWKAWTTQMSSPNCSA